MKFLERALILMVAIGYWLAIIRRPEEPSLLLISGVFLFIYYALMMPVLLRGISFRELFIRGQWRGHHLFTGFVFGLIYGYCVLSFIFHNLQWMDSRSLAENCGLLFSVMALIAWILYRKGRDPYYRRLLIRIAVMAVVLGLSLAAHPLLRDNAALKRMSPL